MMIYYFGVYRKLIALLIVLLSFGGSWAKSITYDLSPYNPQRQVINEMQFPRNHLVLYRGINASQYSVVQAIRAMLGDKSASVESKLYFTIKQELKGEDRTLLSRREVLERYLTLNISSYITDAKKLLIKRNPHLIDQIARNILDEAFTNYYSDASQFLNQYIYYNNGKPLVDWPSAFMYSSIYVEVAKIYSPNIVIFENDGRSLDVNYWNYVNYGFWVKTNRPWVDKGEFLTPYLIHSQDVLGYQYNRTDYNSNWLEYYPLRIGGSIHSFFKYTYEGNNYVMAVDGRSAQHIVKQRGRFFSASSQFEVMSDLPKLSRVSDDSQLPVIGFFLLCSDDQINDRECEVPENFYSAFDSSSLKVPDEIINELNKIKIDNKKIMFIQNK